MPGRAPVVRNCCLQWFGEALTLSLRAAACHAGPLTYGAGGYAVGQLAIHHFTGDQHRKKAFANKPSAIGIDKATPKCTRQGGFRDNKKTP